MAAVDVPAAREGTQLAQEALGSDPLPGHHLHPDLASPPHLRRSRHEGDEALVRFGDEEHPALNAREDAAVIEGDVDVLDRALLGWLSAEHTAGVGHQVRERHAHVFVRDVDAGHGCRATGRGEVRVEVRVERHLDVGVIGDGERLGDDRQLRRFDAKVCAQSLDKGRLSRGRLRGDLIEERLEGRAELPKGEFGIVGHVVQRGDTGRINPSCATDTTSFPSRVNRCPVTKPRAPCAAGLSCA